MINKKYDERIKVWIENNREKVIDIWMDLARIPSVRGESKPGAPFGEECARAMETAVSYFREAGFEGRAVNGTYGVCDYGSAEKTIGLFGHSDVVPAGDGWIYTEPFTPVIRDGYMIGRGVSDNKAGVMQSLCAMTILKECEIPVKSRIRAFVGTNEESGMEDIEAFIRQEGNPDMCLVPDASFPCSLGEKGILRMWAASNASLTDVLDMRGGNAFNTVLDEVHTRLKKNAALYVELERKVAGNTAFVLSEETDGTIHLESKGVSKHAAAPEDSVNAAVLAFELLSSCENLAAGDRMMMKNVAALIGSYYGEGMGIAFWDAHFGPLTAANGMVKVEDGKLWVSVDSRYGTELAPDQLETAIHQAWESIGFQIADFNNRPGYQVDLQSQIPAMMTELYREITGQERQPYYMAGGTYSRYLKNAYSVGAVAPDPDSKAIRPELPTGHGGAHQRDEVICIDDFFQATRMIVHSILLLDQKLND